QGALGLLNLLGTTGPLLSDPQERFCPVQAVNRVAGKRLPRIRSRFEPLNAKRRQAGRTPTAPASWRMCLARQRDGHGRRRVSHRSAELQLCAVRGHSLSRGAGAPRSGRQAPSAAEGTRPTVKHPGGFIASTDLLPLRYEGTSLRPRLTDRG